MKLLYMELRIDSDIKIRDIQKEFNAFYPFLKLEFFKNRHPENKPSPKAEKIDAGKSIQELTKFYESGRINIDSKRTVAEVENDFWETFGLSAQVFRKSGNIWIETSLTDNWTLDKQNKEAELLNAYHEKPLDQRLEDEQMDND